MTSTDFQSESTLMTCGGASIPRTRTVVRTASAVQMARPEYESTFSRMPPLCVLCALAVGGQLQLYPSGVT